MPERRERKKEENTVDVIGPVHLINAQSERGASATANRLRSCDREQVE